jgi:hypothetical protein
MHYCTGSALNWIGECEELTSVGSTRAGPQGHEARRQGAIGRRQPVTVAAQELHLIAAAGSPGAGWASSLPSQGTPCGHDCSSDSSPARQRLLAGGRRPRAGRAARGGGADERRRGGGCVGLRKGRMGG